MKRHSIHAIFVFVLFSCNLLLGQDIELKGKVRHGNSYNDIAQVNVYIKGTAIGTSTNVWGEFTLSVPNELRDSTLVVEHVSFYSVELPIREALNKKIYNLDPRVIMLPGVSVMADKEKPEILKDLPQAHSVIKSESFEIRGYVDAGDLLKTEQSIQVDEELSGKKTVGIRGGNADDVIVLYNGVKLNNVYDNVFDLSLINLEDVSQLEIIRGSNTALYGAEANAGVINIVPKTLSKYTARLQQKIGTYAMGAWDLHINHNIENRLNVSYRFKQGATERLYSQDTTSTEQLLKNKKTYHTVNFVYDIGEGEMSESHNKLNFMYLNSDVEFENQRFSENVMQTNRLLSGRFDGRAGFLSGLKVASSYQWLDEDQRSGLLTYQIDRHVLNRSFRLDTEKQFLFDKLELLLGYQFEQSELDYEDERFVPGEEAHGIESALLQRKKHGFVSIVKLHVPPGSGFYKTTDFNISYRLDDVANTFRNVRYRTAIPEDSTGLSGNDWRESMLKFSSHLVGSSDRFEVDVFLNYGTNFKFPTMFQQISSPSSISLEDNAITASLKPEKNNSTEIGVQFTWETRNEPSLNGLTLSANYFRNEYDNKLRMYYTPYSPVAYYDNVKNAEISGLEAKASMYFIRKKLTLEFGTSNYSISEKAAFPFKSEHKHIMNLILQHAGFSLQLHGFKESEQEGWIRKSTGDFSEVRLKGHTNLDVHLSKTVQLWKTELFLNVSGRNVLGDDTQLEGLALRDRRIYVTFGVQY